MLFYFVTCKFQSKLINIFCVWEVHRTLIIFSITILLFQGGFLNFSIVKKFLELTIIIIISFIIIIFITIRIFVAFISLFQITESSQTNVVNRFNSLLNANHSRLQYSLSKNFPPLAHK